MRSKIKIAVGQMCSSSNVQRNARVVSKLIDKAIEIGAKVLFLPEASDYISRNAGHSVSLAKQTRPDFINVIRQKLKSVNENQTVESLCVAVGVHEPTSGEYSDRKVQNNQLWISSVGEVEQRYQKIHLFDINIPNGPILQESNSVEAGNRILDPFPVSKDTHPDFKVGFSICYDIRFPELALRLREKQANILTYPSAFTTKTGEAHWLELGRARAIDSQCYVVMAAQCGEHDVYADLSEDSKANSEKNRTKRISYGQSVIIGPWGEILAKGPTYLEIEDKRGIDDEGDYYEIFDAELDLDHLENIRSNLPVFSHRRPEIYDV